MANLTTQVVVAGNLTRDPEVRATRNGKAVANLTIASTPRVFDAATKQWSDGEGVFINATAWGDVADNIAASLQKGSRVVAVGWFKSRSYETKDGDKRTATELQIEDIGASLLFATAVPQRVGRKVEKQAANDGWAQGGDTTPW